MLSQNHWEKRGGGTSLMVNFMELGVIVNSELKLNWYMTQTPNTPDAKESYMK